MSFYLHIPTLLSATQEANFIRLARHLIVSSRAPDWNSDLFCMGFTAYDVLTGDELQPDGVTGREGLLISNSLGHGPRAGLPAHCGETWRAYQSRFFGIAVDTPLEGWLLSPRWRLTDNTPIGAAMRLMYVLDYGVPQDWEDIIEGRATSDYLDNGFLWDRVGLAPPEPSKP